MLDFMLWFVSIFFDMFNHLNDYVIIGNLTLLKLLFIVFLFITLLSILFSRRDK